MSEKYFKHTLYRARTIDDELIYVYFFGVNDHPEYIFPIRNDNQKYVFLHKNFKEVSLEFYREKIPEQTVLIPVVDEPTLAKFVLSGHELNKDYETMIKFDKLREEAFDELDNKYIDGLEDFLKNNE